MASASDEENIHLEETGRRTRSGRLVAPPTNQMSTRSTRRSSRKQIIEQSHEPEPEIMTAVTEEKSEYIDSSGNKYHQSEIIEEMLAEAAQGVIIDPTVDIQVEVETTTQENDIESTPLVYDSDMIQAQEIEVQVIQTEDEKSSSFPFGNVPLSENSDGKIEENVTNIADCVDSSLLASLAGDNANSLPSAESEESQSKENMETIAIENNIVENVTIPSARPADASEDSQSDPAIAEDLQNGENESEKTGADVDTDMVSEDEIQPVPKPKVNDTEEISEEGLSIQAQQQTEQPTDTDAISEDELTSSSKKEALKRKADEDYDPGSPTEETIEIPEKKTKVEDEEDKEEKKKEKKRLPELDKYWKAVKDDPTDFTGWTYLLQYVDQENDVEAAREAYDAFLSHYPYCYGYWRKYADYEKRKGNKKKCEEVFERGLKAIPLSVDLWIHYLTHAKTNYGDNEEFIRSQFERALAACGLEFRSDKLWEAFIKWETEGKRYSQVLKIYDRLLATPTQGYNGHFESFQDLINNHPVTTTINTEELKKILVEIRDTEKSSENKTETESNEIVPDDNVKNDDEATVVRDKIIAIRRKIHKATISAVTARWTFEEGIKRPYFHVKPLERCQLKNWKEYLDFEIEQGDSKRIIVLFERCLIACALYDEFWLKLIRYLETQNDQKLIPATRDAFERACAIHHPDKPSLHMMWAAFEECHNNFSKAAEILTNIEKVCPNLLQIAYRRINLERRRGDFDRCKELYEHYISAAKNKNIAGSLAIKYARFCHKIKGDLEGGLDVLKNSLEKDPANTRVALQMIDLALQRSDVDENEVVQIMDRFMARDGMDPEQKVLFAQRKVEFLEDFGSTAKGLQDAQRALQIALTKANEAKKKSESTSPSKKASKDTTAVANAAANTTATSSYNNGSNYTYAGANSGYYGNNQSYQSYDSYGYNHWQQYNSGYSGYNQWSGYGNYY